MESNQRLIAIYHDSVEALKGVVREHKITQKELQDAGWYFNRLGQSTMFPSLLAVSLAMTSVDATMDKRGTRPNLQGPFYKPNAPVRPDGDLFEHDPPPGSPVLNLSGVVRDAATGAPIAGAEIDFWQADHEGKYDHEGFHLAGVVITDEQGRYRLRTAVPKDYSDHDDDPIGELFRAMGRHNRRCAHIHLKIRVDGVERLVTQLFIAGNPYLDSDYVEGAVSDDLTIHPEPIAGAPDLQEFQAVFDFAIVGLSARAAAE